MSSGIESYIIMNFLISYYFILYVSPKAIALFAVSDSWVDGPNRNQRRKQVSFNNFFNFYVLFPADKGSFDPIF